MTDIFEKQGTLTSAESSGASLATATAVAATSILDNSANLDDECIAELVAGFGTAPTLPAGVELYLVSAPDGTNYGSVDTTSGASYIPAQAFRGYFSLALSQTGTQRLLIDGIPLSPRKYKPYILNRTGQTQSSGWTLKFYGGRRQSA